ncbi:hypothetical protein QCD83_14365 [Pseudomonas savastanoi pv. phaseolicola]|uniref:hypothetical protein n=1 Tax=Pseudomonas TaxID=286 RepID=UPI0005A530B1|nr:MULTISPECIES: hypothetical protein [Pseudomonas]MBN4183966.1 hypothetical protein [Pseudomonas savastanoi pv. phaseolicola]MDG6380095.1 hypothetical protein [Pseudomonas savastanoi pv. phaseolicola]MDG6390395.1 hypothetical protein [Pseudomonas savastanoi pv. phaseolicola]ODS48286.1 MAG: hypothetical protein BEH78_10225 [Pseudomonas sp. BDAL1]QDV99059.1 hypothetical protein FFH21_003310 [Pseudomonas sp. KBS0707]
MSVVKLFDTATSPVDVFDEVVNSGIAGVYGGRLAVREVASQVGGLAKINGVCVSQEGGYISSGLTHNHSRTELAYMFDDRKFSVDQALDAVEKTYDITFP